MALVAYVVSRSINSNPRSVDLDLIRSPASLRHSKVAAWRHIS